MEYAELRDDAIYSPQMGSCRERQIRLADLARRVHITAATVSSLYPSPFRDKSTSYQVIAEAHLLADEIRSGAQPLTTYKVNPGLELCQPA
jgi:hypothetical protein